MACYQIAPNGERSKLFDKIYEAVKDEGVALEEYAKVMSESSIEFRGNWVRASEMLGSTNKTKQELIRQYRLKGQFDNNLEPEYITYSNPTFSKGSVEADATKRRLDEAVKDLKFHDYDNSSPLSNRAHIYIYNRQVKKSVSAIVSEDLQSGFSRESYIAETKNNLNNQLPKDRKDLNPLEAVRSTLATIEAEHRAEDLVQNPDASLDDEIAAFATKQFVRWGQAADMGTVAHLFLEVAANNIDKPDNEIMNIFNKRYDEFSKKFPENSALLYNGLRVNLLYQIKNFIEAEKKRLGDVVYIEAERKVYDKNAGIPGTIDLMFYRSNGHVVKYDYKFSFKASDFWSKYKDREISVSQNVYTNIVQNNGIRVDGTFVLPFHMNQRHTTENGFKEGKVNVQFTENTLEKEGKTQTDILSQKDFQELRKYGGIASFKGDESNADYVIYFGDEEKGDLRNPKDIDEALSKIPDGKNIQIIVDSPVRSNKRMAYHIMSTYSKKPVLVNANFSMDDVKEIGKSEDANRILPTTVPKSAFDSELGVEREIDGYIKDAFGFERSMKDFKTLTYEELHRMFKDNIKKDGQGNPYYHGFYQGLPNQQIELTGDQEKDRQILGNIKNKNIKHLRDSINDTQQYLKDLLKSYKQNESEPKKPKTLSNRGAKYIKRITEKYKRDHNWKVMDTDAAKEALNAGILLIYNEETKVIDIISYPAGKTDRDLRLENGKKAKSILEFFGEKEGSLEVIKNKETLLSPTVGSLELIRQGLYALGDNRLFANGYKPGRLISMDMTTPKYGLKAADFGRTVQKNLELILNKSNIEGHVNYKERLEETRHDFQVDYIAETHSYIDSIIKKDVFISGINDKTKISEKLKTGSDRDRLIELQNLQKTLGQKANVEMDNEESHLYAYVSAAIAQLKGHLPTLSFNEDIKNLGNILFDVNKQTSSPTKIPNKYISKLFVLQSEAKQRFTQAYRDYKSNQRQEFLNPLYRKKLSKVAQHTIGNTYPAFDNIYEESDGEKVMSVRSPFLEHSSNDNRKPLIREEQRFIANFIKVVSDVRITERNDDNKVYEAAKNAADKYLSGKELTKAEKDAINNPLARQVPLMRSSLFSQMRDGNVENVIKSSVRDMYNVDDMFSTRADEAYIYDEEDDFRTEMTFNLMKNDSDLDQREALLKERPTRDFEKNLELIIDSMKHGYERKKAYDDVLSQINALKGTLLLENEHFFKKIDEVQDFMNKYIGEIFFNKRNMKPEELGLAKFTDSAQRIASIGAIGGSVQTGITQMLQGLWANIATIVGNDPDMFGYKEFTKAYMYVLENAGSITNNANFMNALNEYYRLNGMDVNAMVHKMSESEYGMMNFKSNFLYFFSSAPDYYNRMAIFIAQAVKDGVLDINMIGKMNTDKSALTYNKATDKLDYDPSRDKRFNILFDSAADKSSDEYKRQEALYKFFINENRKTGLQQSENKLELPYTLTHANSMKDYADTIHGYYSDDTKPFLHNTVLGSMVTQFQSWLFAKRDRYFMKSFVSEVQQKATVKYTKDGKPYYVWEGRPMEGILFSLMFTAQELKESRNLVKAWKSLPDFRKRNLYKMGMDVTLFSALASVSSLIDFDELEKEEGFTGAVKETMARSFAYSFRDLSIFNNAKQFFSAEMPVVSIAYLYNLTATVFEIATFQENPLALMGQFGALRPIYYSIKDELEG